MNVALFAALLVALSAPVVIGSSALQLATGVALAATPGQDQRDQWVDRLQAARRRVEEARRNEVQSRTAYGKMRSRRKFRGEKRKEITEKRDRTHQARIDAERALEVLLEKARREKVPPGWVREALDGFEQSPASLAN